MIIEDNFQTKLSSNIKQSKKKYENAKFDRHQQTIIYCNNYIHKIHKKNLEQKILRASKNGKRFIEFNLPRTRNWCKSVSIELNDWKFSIENYQNKIKGIQYNLHFFFDSVAVDGDFIKLELKF